MIIVIWQLVFYLQLQPDYIIPGPRQVWDALANQAEQEILWQATFNSIRRAAQGFIIAIIIATPIGLALGLNSKLRAIFGPILTGLQVLPSVAWVPAAIIWFGLSDATIYTVILLGAVPSIANGLIAGMDQIPTIYLRVGQVLGAKGLRPRPWRIVLPAAWPGYLAGLEQGWAFAWRSLMAAELIAVSPALGPGLGQMLDTGRTLGDMALVLGSIAMIMAVGILVERRGVRAAAAAHAAQPRPAPLDPAARRRSMGENAAMASTPFSARGAVDLGALATARQNQQKAAQAMANAPAGVVIDVTTENFQAEVIDRSMQVPVVLDLWAEWCGPCKQLSPILEKLAAEDGGRWVLAKVDVDAEQQIAAAFQVQSIPSVFAVIAGPAGAPVPGRLPRGADPPDPRRAAAGRRRAGRGRHHRRRGTARARPSSRRGGRAAGSIRASRPPSTPSRPATGMRPARPTRRCSRLAGRPRRGGRAGHGGPVRPNRRRRRAGGRRSGLLGGRLRGAAQRLADGLRPRHRRGAGHVRRRARGRAGPRARVLPARGRRPGGAQGAHVPGQRPVLGAPLR